MDKQQITISQEDAEELLRIVQELVIHFEALKEKTDSLLDNDLDDLERETYNIWRITGKIQSNVYSLEFLTRNFKK